MTMILGFIEGKELYTLLQQQRRFPEEKTRTISVQILRALDHMHRKSIVHRDVNASKFIVHREINTGGS